MLADKKWKTQKQAEKAKNLKAGPLSEHKDAI